MAKTKKVQKKAQKKAQNKTQTTVKKAVALKSKRTKAASQAKRPAKGAAKGVKVAVKPKAKPTIGAAKASQKASQKGSQTKMAVESKSNKKTQASKSNNKLQAPSAPSKSKSSTENRYSLNVGERAPSFTGVATSGRTLSLDHFSGRKVVLYFYPKDNTPGCTLEGQDFKNLHRNFQEADCEIVGVSMDSLRSHESFKNKCGFPFDLLSDHDGSICRAFDVIQMKSMYGRSFEGIERSTFLIDGSGTVKAVWRKVKVDGHAQEVLNAVKSL